jgi:type IV pilus assembly protein PilE
MDHRHRQRGVTLIELIVVVIIVGILASVAIPSYRAYVMRSQRADAKDALLALATAQEKHYLQCNSYGDNLANATDCAAGNVLSPGASKNGWYDLSIDVADNVSFTVSATAVATEGQFQDTDCRSFTITNAGVRTAENAGGADNSAECWQ